MRGKNISVAAISTILLLGLIVYLAPSIPPSIPQVKASSRTISLVGTTGAYYYWNDTNPTITVTQGDTLTIDVSSSNSVPHRLLIDLDKDGSAINLSGPVYCQFQSWHIHVLLHNPSWINARQLRYPESITIHS